MQEGHANLDLQDWDCYHHARGHRTTKTHPNLVTIMVQDEATTKKEKKKTLNTVMYADIFFLIFFKATTVSFKKIKQN